MGCEPFPSRTSRLGASLFQGVRLRSRLTAIRVVAPATTEATILVVRWRQSPHSASWRKIALTCDSDPLQTYNFETYRSLLPTLKAADAARMP